MILVEFLRFLSMYVIAKLLILVLAHRFADTRFGPALAIYA